MFKVVITQRILDDDWNGKPYHRKEHLEASFENLREALSFIEVVLSVAPFSSAEIKKEEEDDREEDS